MGADAALQRLANRLHQSVRDRLETRPQHGFQGRDAVKPEKPFFGVVQQLQQFIVDRQRDGARLTAQLQHEKAMLGH